MQKPTNKYLKPTNNLPRKHVSRVTGAHLPKKEFALAAVTQSGDALRYVDEALKADREVVLAAVAQSGDALQYADKA